MSASISTRSVPFRPLTAAALGSLLASSVLGSCTAPQERRPRIEHPTGQIGPTQQDDIARCTQEGVVLVVTAPDARDRSAGKTATLQASFDGDGALARARNVCLIGDGRPRLVSDTVTTQIRADDETLQRIEIDGRPLLLRIPPGETVQIRHHDCSDWIVEAEWLDDGTMTPRSSVAYGRADQPCPAGFVDGGEIHEADDRRCGGVDHCEWRRCLRAATLRRASSSDTPIVLHGGPRIPLGEEPHATTPYGGFCPVFEMLETPTETALIAPGFGEHWVLDVDEEGRLQGRIDDGS